MSNQLTFGLVSGETKVEPFRCGDIIVTHSYKRYVVTGIDSNIHGLVFFCTNLACGSEAIVLEREIAYRSR